jgi:glycolate oxidase FAD binding subunit
VAQAVEARWFYDWGGGLIWIATDPRGDAGAQAIRSAVRSVGGHATLIRAPDEVRASIDVFEPLSDAVMRITAGIKASFDPRGVLSPGRMYAGV